MANYQVPTEGACSLTPVNTVYVKKSSVYFGIKLDHSLTCKHLNKAQVMVSVMTLRVWPMSGVHLSAPLDYAPQQGKK